MTAKQKGNAMNEQQLIEWAKTNFVCWDGLTQEQREFLVVHREDVGRYGQMGLVGQMFLPPRECDGELVFRIRPDYEPPEVGRWVEYAVEIDRHGHYSIQAKERYSLGAMPSFPGFGGVKFRMPGGAETEFMPQLACFDDAGPYTPIAVRFWEVGQ